MSAIQYINKNTFLQSLFSCLEKNEKTFLYVSSKKQLDDYFLPNIFKKFPKLHSFHYKEDAENSDDSDSEEEDENKLDKKIDERNKQYEEDVKKYNTYKLVYSEHDINVGKDFNVCNDSNIFKNIFIFISSCSIKDIQRVFRDTRLNRNKIHYYINSNIKPIISKLLPNKKIYELEELQYKFKIELLRKLCNDSPEHKKLMTEDAGFRNLMNNNMIDTVRNITQTEQIFKSYLNRLGINIEFNKVGEPDNNLYDNEMNEDFIF